MTASTLQWIPILPDPDLTPLQHSHRMALDASRTELDLELPATEALRGVNRALLVYHKAILRPRTIVAWAYVQCELWNARAAAVRSGVSVRGDEVHTLISRCYTEASARVEQILAAEASGRADVRV